MFALAPVLLLSGLVLLMAYGAGPPPGSTGGFGERTCHQCHFDNRPSEASDSLTIAVPARYTPRGNYRIRVRIMRGGMKNAGFQFSARFEDSGGQAGVLRSLDTRTSTIPNPEQTLCYIQHTGEGQKLTAENEAVWKFQWEAPNSRTPVLIHVAANAANQDDSEFGDFVYTRELLIPTQE